MSPPDTLPTVARRGPRVVTAGLATLDVTQTVARPPRSNEKLVARSLRVDVGGPAANAAGTAAALGGEAAVLTALGSSSVARLIREGLETCGVEVWDVGPDDMTLPAVSMVLVEEADGSRSIVSTNAQGRSTPTDNVLAAVAGAGACLVDGHYPQLCLDTARAARWLGVPVILDGGSWKEGTEELLRLSDVAVVSADFAAPGGAPVLDHILRTGCQVAARTDGPHPILLASREGSTAIEVPQLAVSDTTAAGDVLHGALAWAIARGGLRVPFLSEALRFAAVVASVSCGYRGPRGWVAHDEACAEVDAARRRLLASAALRAEPLDR